MQAAPNTPFRGIHLCKSVKHSETYLLATSSCPPAALEKVFRLNQGDQAWCPASEISPVEPSPPSWQRLQRSPAEKRQVPLQPEESFLEYILHWMIFLLRCVFNPFIFILLDLFLRCYFIQLTGIWCWPCFIFCINKAQPAQYTRHRSERAKDRSIHGQARKKSQDWATYQQENNWGDFRVQVSLQWWGSGRLSGSYHHYPTMSHLWHAVQWIWRGWE